MMVLYLTADPGTTIGNAFNESMRIADTLIIDVEFVFNGITCICILGMDVSTGIAAYDMCCKSKGKETIAVTRKKPY